MGGGLMQLVAYGAQDIYLTGNPQITFFKVVYRRHTNFSMETVQQTISGSSKSPAEGDSPTSGTVTISRNGDLVYKVYVRGVSSSEANSTDGNDLVSEVELEIGGQRIDKQTSEWMKVWNELTTPYSKALGLLSMTGGDGFWGHSSDSRYNTSVNQCHIPLQFWFCRNPGLALPLIALQYHEVKLKFTWGAQTYATDCTVWCDYIYLDTDERRRFAQVSHEYLIEQIQIQSGSDASSQKLNFNHPVKELIWTEKGGSENQQTFDNKTKLQLNGHDRFSEQVKEYFLLRQPYDYHTSVPQCNLPFGMHHKHTGKRAHPKRITVKDIGNNVIGIQQDAHSLITGLRLVFENDVTFTASGGNVGYGVGTANDGSDDSIVTTVVDGITNDASVTQKKNHHIDLVLAVPVGTSDNPHAASTSKRTIYINITTDNAPTSPVKDIVVLMTTHPLISVQKPFGHHPSLTSQFSGLINCYSFALKPEEHQPSGTCNFSRIDNAKLIFNGGTSPNLSNIYAVNYNVLRIMSGMGGLAYSN